MKISLGRRRALTVVDGAFSHKIDYVTIFWEILKPEGHPYRISGSKVTAILLIGWILSICGASSEGSAPAACAAGLLYWYSAKNIKQNHNILYFFLNIFKQIPKIVYYGIYG